MSLLLISYIMSLVDFFLPPPLICGNFMKRGKNVAHVSPNSPFFSSIHLSGPPSPCFRNPASAPAKSDYTCTSDQLEEGVLGVWPQTPPPYTFKIYTFKKKSCRCVDFRSSDPPDRSWSVRLGLLFGHKTSFFPLLFFNPFFSQSLMAQVPP